MANRVAEVNRELRLRGVAERLTRGNGYYYFRDGDACFWRNGTMVCTFRADDMPVARWLGEWEFLSGRKLPAKIAKPVRSRAVRGAERAAITDASRALRHANRRAGR